MFTASSGKTVCNEVAEKAAQRENKTLVDEEVMPVAADNSAKEKRKEDAQSKLQAYVESIPNGTFISCLPLVNDDDDRVGCHLALIVMMILSTTKTTKGMVMSWKMTKPTPVSHLTKRARPKCCLHCTETL